MKKRVISVIILSILILTTLVSAFSLKDYINSNPIKNIDKLNITIQKYIPNFILNLDSKLGEFYNINNFGKTIFGISNEDQVQLIFFIIMILTGIIIMLVSYYILESLRYTKKLTSLLICFGIEFIAGITGLIKYLSFLMMYLSKILSFLQIFGISRIITLVIIIGIYFVIFKFSLRQEKKQEKKQIIEKNQDKLRRGLKVVKAAGEASIDSSYNKENI